MIRAAVVGFGKMGMSHHAILNAHPRAQVVAVCDASGYIVSTLKKHIGIEPFKDYRKLLDRCELDCIVIATPSKTHADIATHAMSKGVHVFCEKPLTLSASESQSLARKAEETGLVNQVGYHNRFVGTFREARRLIKAGAIGEPHHFTAEAYGNVVNQPKGSTWRAKHSEGGGCVYDYAPHVLDLVNFVVGPPRGVGGTVLKSIFSKEVEDAVYATLDYDGNLSGQLAVNWSDPAYRKMTTRITVWGTKGKVFADRQECSIFLNGKDGFEELEAGWTTRYITDVQAPVGYYLRGEEYSAQIEHFVAGIEGTLDENINPFASGARTDELVEQLLQDGRSRKAAVSATRR